jgi:D-alanine-D-alanine ligase-like ATP-grasp enzyme
VSQPFTSTLLAALAQEMGITVRLEPHFRHAGMVTTKRGGHVYFKLATLDVNPSAAAKIAGDKDYASFFIQELGYPIAEGRPFFSDEWCVANSTKNDTEAAVSYAEQLGYPVIAKPNAKAQGNSVQKVYTTDALRRALQAIFAIDNIALIQRPVRGRDYRLIVYKDRVPIVYERIPLTVIGDGRQSIGALLTQKIASYTHTGRHLRLSTEDERIVAKLRQSNRDLETIPQAGSRIQLLDNANMSAGGEAVDLSDQVHASYREMAQRVTHDMGLSLCGVDLMTERDLREPIGDYTIIEINDHPGLEHYSALSGAALERVKALYREVLLGLYRT